MKFTPPVAAKFVAQPYQAQNSGSAPASPSISTVASIAFFFGLCYTFLSFSHSVEFIDNTGRLHLSLITGLMCVVGLLATGGIPPMLLSKPGVWLSLFSFWIFFGLPFSTWRGGSVADFTGVWIKSYITFFLIGGLIFSLEQVRKMAFVLALCALSQIYLVFHGGVQSDNRLTMSYGSLGNSNDLATALLISLPFLVFVILNKKSNVVLRILFIPTTVVLVVAVLKTGSRGGLVAIAALVAVTFLRSAGANKLKIAVAAILIVGLFAAFVPSGLRARYMTIFSSKAGTDGTDGVSSALDSSNARRELLKNSVLLTLKHPVFGVGLGQFAPQSFNLLVSRGQPGMWFTSHDVFGLVGAEIGIPGLIFFCGTIVVSLRILHRLSKLPKVTPELELISGLASAVFMSIVAYVTCGVFSTQAYTYQLPVLASVAAALDRVAAPYITAAGLATVPIFTAPAPFVNRRLAQRPVTAAS
jgi:O-antigen ligase